MNKRTLRSRMTALLSGLALIMGLGTAQAYLSPDYSNPAYAPGGATPFVIGPGNTPDYLTTPNWAYTPPIRKFVDTLPGLGAANVNNLGQYIPVAVPDIVTYPGSDYYEIELREFSEKMHSDLPPTTMRAYRQVNAGTVTSSCTDPALSQPNPCTEANNTAPVEANPRQFGPLIVAQKDRPVRIKFINSLPTGAGGDLFIPVDQTIMGAGPFQVDYDPVTKLPVPITSGTFTQNRAELHLHGGRTPWISDGTPHQWITPSGEVTSYPTGVSMTNVPDMPDPGPGAQTYYYTNQQSSRLMFYHDHSWGITRLNVYVGGAAGYVIRDAVEQQLIADGKIPAAEIPLIIQDKTFVDGDPASPTYVLKTDPTWKWGTGSVGSNGFRTPQSGDLWWPHIYMPAQNPFDITGIAPMGRWAYGPYFWPATGNPYQPIPNPYYSPDCVPGGDPATTPGLLGGPYGDFCQPPEIPATPNPSWGAEAFMDTPTINGTAYPVLTVEPKAYRFRILNAAHDRFVNLQLYKADPAPAPLDYSGEFPPSCASYTAPGYGGFSGICASNTEVKMVPAQPGGVGKPATWPEDGRPGGVPDWNTAGPNWIMIGSEGGFLPRPVVLPPQPLNWNADVTTFNAGNVNTGSLILAPAERADVIVDFSGIPSGTTLILYNDAPAPWPALDPHYDYYTGAPDNRAMGGADTTPIGFGPNTRTLMQIKVQGAPAAAFDVAALNAAFTPANPALGVFRQSQESLVVGQGNMNPTGDPAYYEAFAFDGVAYDALNTIYGTAFAATFPNWGVARINDKQISFKTINPDGSVNPTVQTVTMKAKAIQDEQGETFDDYGRMRAALGLTLSEPGAGKVNFIVQTYSDPSTEVLAEEGIQVWKITHNGVDTHPIHFHLFDVQILNRVGWDGFIRLPDPTELGWKETVRVSPLEDTIVAVRPVKPMLPFGIPSSVRPLNPATPLGDATELSMVDPTTGQAWATPNVNRIINLGWEYVWHCHILSHEENDMMRPISYNPGVTIPDAPTGLATNASFSNGNVTLTWVDPTPKADPATLGNPKNEINFIIERCSGLDCSNFVPVGTVLANATSYTETALSSDRYSYVVKAYNAAGTSLASNIVRTQSDSIIDGVCGSANGQNFSAIPTAGLCASGAASAVINTNGVLTWSCTGINSTINASCTAAIPTYAVTFAAGPNGALSGDTIQTVTYNLSTTTVTAVPNVGYHFVNWTEGGTPVSTNADLMVTNIVAPHSYLANFAINTYILNFMAGVGGSVTGTTPQTLNYFANATTVTAVPAAGYRFVNWTDSIGNVVSTTTDLTINNVAVANTYTANFLATYTVTLDRCISGPTLVDLGAQPTYSFGTTGFDVAGVQVNGTPVTLTNGSYFFPTGIAANQIITASYTLNPAATPNYLKLSTELASATGYTTLQAAYAAAANGNAIQMKAVNIASGALTANRNITVTLQGGYNNAYTASCGVTSAQGGLTIGSGTVIADNLIIK